MKFSLKIDSDNEALQDPLEVPRILGLVAERVENGWTDGPVIDSNGNTVGSWAMERP